MSPSRSKSPTNDRIDALPPAPTADPLSGPRADLARAIPRRPRVSWWLGVVLAACFAALVTPAITAERWLSRIGIGEVVRGERAPITVRVPPFAGYYTATGHTGGGGIVIARGEVADRDTAADAGELRRAQPDGATPYVAFLLLVGVLAGLFTHHTRRSTRGRLLRVQLVSLALIVAISIVVKLVMLTTALSVLVVPVALFAMVPTLVLDRIVGLATGTLAALVLSLLVPFDAGVAVMLLVQASAAGLMIDERPKRRLRAILVAGAVATLFTAVTYPLMLYLSVGRLPIAELRDPLHSAWLASALGPALATALALVCVPLYQLAVGEITQQQLVELEDLSHPLLRQIADKAPGTWQHSLTMANMAELAANAIGASGRLVRVGAYFHDLGKSLNPKYFIENLEPGETSPHDQLPPETSCDAIFKHVTEGILAARRAGLHERVVDFMHMHHGNGVLEYFWAKCREQGNPRGLTVEHFRYPGVPPQSRETAILSICDAVEAAARTLKNPDQKAIDNLVQRIVYGKLHVGQLDESGLSMRDLRCIAESLRDTIRHANHGRIEYPWQKADQDASAQPEREPLAQTTNPRLDSLDRPARPDSVAAPAPRASSEALAKTDSAGATPRMKPAPRDASELAILTTAPVAQVAPGLDPPPSPRGPLPTDHDVTVPAPKHDLHSTLPAPKGEADEEVEEVLELRASKPKVEGEPAERPSVRELRAEPSTTSEPLPAESDPRLRRITNPLGERVDEPEVERFAADAKQALDEAAKDVAARTRGQPPAPQEPAAPTHESPPAIEIVAEEPGIGSKPREAAPAARERAATLPPVKPPTTPPPLGRRSPTLPPTPVHRPPTEPPGGTAPPPTVVRTPAPAQVPLPGVTAPPPSTIRPPAMNYLDDMITLRPQYGPRRDLVAAREEATSITVEPQTPPPDRLDDARVTRPSLPRDAPAAEPGSDEDAPITQPRMPAAIGDATDPDVQLPPSRSPASAWARRLAARLDAQLDDEFGAETPVMAPTRAELQALLGAPPDVTKQQSLDELERLQRDSRERPSAPELDFARQRPLPTAEVDESDIEAAIELAPPARSSAIGVAKKKREE